MAFQSDEERGREIESDAATPDRGEGADSVERVQRKAWHAAEGGPFHAAGAEVQRGGEKEAGQYPTSVEPGADDAPDR
jgi:hypothetical protein